jgi:serine/threonine protein kinase
MLRGWVAEIRRSDCDAFLSSLSEAVRLGVAVSPPPVDRLFNMLHRVGQGGFGVVYACELYAFPGTLFAMKKSLRPGVETSLAELDAYRLLNGSVGFPRVHFHGRHSDGSMCVVMDLLGPSLEALFRARAFHFSMKTICLIAEQLLDRAESMHAKGLVHRDWKPENILIGGETQRHILHVVDFGLSTSFVDKTGRHVAPASGKPVLGTARFSSTNSHLGKELSRRDDLESIAFLLIYFARGGSLPWNGLDRSTIASKYRAIGEMKRSIDAETLCKGLPLEFGYLLEYARSLKFTDTPAYGFLRMMFHQLFKRQHVLYDMCFDWMTEPPSSLTPHVQFASNATRRKHRMAESLYSTYVELPPLPASAGARASEERPPLKLPPLATTCSPLDCSSYIYGSRPVPHQCLPRVSDGNEVIQSHTRSSGLMSRLFRRQNALKKIQ